MCRAKTFGPSDVRFIGLATPRPLFSERYDVFPPKFVKSRSRKVACYYDRIALKFDRHLARAGNALTLISRLRDFKDLENSHVEAQLSGVLSRWLLTWQKERVGQLNGLHYVALWARWVDFPMYTLDAIDKTSLIIIEVIFETEMCDETLHLSCLSV